ncbi:hypothetical protein TCAL_08708 [Tigriopus californicus]|uniref:Uncharacterized protein n=1 Tax=Tigriopus californicus TaxID=6832 RepID=A0A553P005_TIGCA|nr:uncharacterized protein LOC131886863 [Tigriopus californicus]TRY71015.1 hypothetical protein TCAL_08708 [Tigriopus californicus]|eukprot:TCALIF_08708-PA protein Name:"Protein of unknown function" AED:0.00 eAED:0.00 QI:530/1/1/1/1/1/3/1461/447
MGRTTSCVVLVAVELLHIVCCLGLAMESPSKAVGKSVPVDSSAMSVSSGRDLSDFSDSDKTMAGLGGLMTMALVGIITKLYGDKNVRQDLYGSSVNRRDGQPGHPHPHPQSNYVNRINHFESNIKRNLQSSAQGARNIAKNGLRRSGNAVINTAKVARNGIRNLVRGAQRVARKTTLGVTNIGRLAHRGVARVGHGITRMGRVSTRGLSRMSHAAAQGVFGFGRLYTRQMGKIGSITARSIGNIGSNYKRGLKRFGSGFSRGLSRIGGSYRRGISRMGSAASQATNSISHVASESVSRIGELASDSAQHLGGLATNIVEVAANVPRRVVEVAKEKKVRDCLLQTICYASTPLLSPRPEQIRQRRSLIQSLPKEDGRAVTSVNKDLILDDDSLKRKDGAALTIDDCEVFKCPVASIGRQAFGVMSRFGKPGQEIVNKRSMSGSSPSSE